MKIILGVCGSVSAYKTPWLVRELRRHGAEVRVVMTQSATHFVTALALQNVSRFPVIVDPFAPEHQSHGSWHVELARWADQVLVAPCSANTLARLASGHADDALSLLLLSLPRETRLTLAPAMDPDMWLHPTTRRNVQQVIADGAHLIPPEEGELASGLLGPGRLPEPQVLANLLLGPRPLQGKRVMVTAGPTHERIDAVRFLGNDSSGKMGYALAAEAARLGAEVTLVSGPVALPVPPGVTRVSVESARDMLAACQQIHQEADVILKAAAVADFAPSQRVEQKLKKESLGDHWSLPLVKNPDILAWLGAHKPPEQLLVGFALETDDAEANARSKLERKRCDLVILNRGGVPDSGFGGDRNTVTLVSRDEVRPLPAMSKVECARHIWRDLLVRMGLQETL